MKYYRVRFTLNNSIRGTSNFIKNSLFRESAFKNFYWKNPSFIGNLKERIDFKPDVIDVELDTKSKLLDLIENAGPVSLKLLISGKLKLIIERYRKTGIQYFQFNVIKSNVVYSDYWVLHMYEFNQEFIDFPKSTIIYEKNSEDFETTYQIEKIKLDIKSEDEFDDHLARTRDKLETATITKLMLKNNIKGDFFALNWVSGGTGYFVSENLKLEIEHAGCTGIEFQPSYLSYDEWTQREGPRDQDYGRSY